MAWCKSWKRALNGTHRKQHKDGVKGGKQAKDEKRMQNRYGKWETGRSLYIPMHQSGFEKCVSCLTQKRIASNQSPAPLKPVLSSSLQFLGFPGSHKKFR